MAQYFSRVAGKCFWGKGCLGLPETSATRAQKTWGKWLERWMLWEANKHKILKHTELSADTCQRGWKWRACPAEVGCKHLVVRSTTRLLEDMMIRARCQVITGSWVSLMGQREGSIKYLENVTGSGGLNQRESCAKCGDELSGGFTQWRRCRIMDFPHFTHSKLGF